MSGTASRFVRSVSGIAAGALILSGASLAMAAPASAAESDVVYVTAADVDIDGADTYLGWHEGYGNVPPVYSFDDDGLHLANATSKSQILNGLVEAGAPGRTISSDALGALITSAGITLAHGNASLQVPVTWDAEGTEGGWATLYSAYTYSQGTDTTFTLDGLWASSKAIGDIAKDEAVPLTDLLTVLADRADLAYSGFGVQSEASAVDEAIVEALLWDSTTYMFTPEPATATTTVVTTSPSESAIAGAEVAITAAVTPATAVGTVEIFDDNESIGDGDVVDGKFTVTTDELGVWTHELTAVFTPEDVDAFEESTSAAVSFTVNQKPVLKAGTVTVTGTQAVGNTLTATPSGWPAGATLSYQWGSFLPGQQHSGDISTATTSTFKVTKATVGTQIWVSVTGTMAGFEPNYAHGTAATPQLPAADAPVADSSDLAVYLKSMDVTTQPQTSTGLPAGDLNPGEDYKSTVKWFGPDTFVDVYMYSTPIFVGTFPVVDGEAQITLSADVLSQLEAGNHTLVVSGQTSGMVQSVAVSVGESTELASTGFEGTLGLGLAGLLLLAGIGFVGTRAFASRRILAQK